MAKNKEKKANQEEKELTKRQRLFNKISTIFQVILVLICVVISIIVIANPGGYAEKPEDCRTGMMFVKTHSMEPTIKTGDIIFADDAPEGVLPLGTVVTFAKYDAQHKGYYLDTHRIVGYYCENKDDSTLKDKFYYVKGEMETVADLPDDCKLLGYVTRGDYYTELYGATLDDCRIFVKDAEGNLTDTVDKSKDDSGYRKLDEVLAVWSGSRIGGVGSVIEFLQQPVAFALIILLPLVLLFGYNIFILVKMIIAEKTRKAREAAIAEVSANQIDEEEIKRRAIEEYLASLKKEEENKEE